MRIRTLCFLENGRFFDKIWAWKQLESEPEARGTWYLTPNYQNICTTVALQNTFKSPIVFAAKSKSWSTLYVRIPLKMLDKKFIKDLKVARATTKDRLNLPALIKTLLLLKIKTKCATTCKALYNLIWMLELLCFFKILSYRRLFYLD